MGGGDKGGWGGGQSGLCGVLGSHGCLARRCHHPSGCGAAQDPMGVNPPPPPPPSSRCDPSLGLAQLWGGCSTAGLNPKSCSLGRARALLPKYSPPPPHGNVILCSWEQCWHSLGGTWVSLWLVASR